MCDIIIFYYMLKLLHILHTINMQFRLDIRLHYNNFPLNEFWIQFK